MANFFDTVIGVLRQNEKFFSAEGELLRNAVYEAAMKMDADLLKMPRFRSFDQSLPEKERNGGRAILAEPGDAVDGLDRKRIHNRIFSLYSIKIVFASIYP